LKQKHNQNKKGEAAKKKNKVKTTTTTEEKERNRGCDGRTMFAVSTERAFDASSVDQQRA
jgi:hypothetical protein